MQSVSDACSAPPESFEVQKVPACDVQHPHVLRDARQRVYALLEGGYAALHAFLQTAQPREASGVDFSETARA